MDASPSTRTSVMVVHTAVAAMFSSVGVLAGIGIRPLYDYSWSHPMVMLTGQLVLLGVFAACARFRGVRWPVQCAFWVYTGATAGPLVCRAADELHGTTTALLVLTSAVVFSVFVVRWMPAWPVGVYEPGSKEPTAPQVDC